jgi:hypothetical protein
MSWILYQTNVLLAMATFRFADDPDGIAEFITKEYDSCIKRGGDMVYGVPVLNGNVSGMKKIIADAFKKGFESDGDNFNLLEENLDNFCKFNSKLGGHPTNKLDNVFASTGSLGHGLPMALGIALGEKIKKTNKNVYVIIGDGESNEGTIWESALLASNHNLDNLYCIMDYNHSNDRALKLDNIVEKFKSASVVEGIKIFASSSPFSFFIYELKPSFFYFRSQRIYNIYGRFVVNV